MLDADRALEQLKAANERVVTLRMEYQDLWDWYKEGGHQFTFLDYDAFRHGEPDLPDDLRTLQQQLDKAKEEQSRLRVVWRTALDQRNRM